MPESQERGADEKELVALCTRSLSTDAELRVSAQRYLRERIEASQPDPEEIRNATERLRGGRTKILRPLFVLVVVALSALPIITLVNDGLTLHSLAKSIAMIGSDLPELPVERTAVGCLSKGLSKEERFFLGSIPESDSPSARHQALWRSDPSNPALFIDYARFYREDGETAVARLPEDFLETGRRLDPDNGFFPAIQGGALANDSVDRLMRLSEARIDDMLNQAKEDLILDEGQYRDALALLYEAASKPRFRSYNTQLLSRRIGLFEHDVDLAKRVAQLAYIADLPAIELKLQDLCNLAMVEAISMARNHEVEGFVRLNNAWERVLLLFLKNEGDLLVNTMLCRSSITRSSRVFAKCADRLSLDEIAQTWRSREEAIEGPKKTRWASPHDPMWDLLDDSGGELIRMGVRILPLQVSSPPPITESDVRPARYAEHEFFARIGKLGLWIHFAMLGLTTFFYRFRGGRLLRKSSSDIPLLLTVADWVRLVGLGIVAPLVAWTLARRFTPFGGLQWNLLACDPVSLAIQHQALGWMILFSSLIVARRILGRRGRVLALGDSVSWISWIGLLAAVISIFTTDLQRKPSEDANTTWSLWLLGLSSIAFMGMTGRALFSRSSALLRRVALSRILTQVWLVAMLILAISMQIHHWLEFYWLEQDTLLEISSEAPGFGRYEAQIASIMRSELLALLENTHPE